MSQKGAIAGGTESFGQPAIRDERRIPGLGLAFVLILTASLAMVAFLHRLLRADIFVPDARQHVWWAYRFADPSLFLNDPIADFFSQPLVAPYGYRAIYWLLAPWVDAQVLSELVPFALAVAVSVLAYLIGRRVAGNSPAGGLVAAAFAAIVLLPMLKGGLPRAFALPILMLGLWALLAERNRWLGLAFLLSALFYPQLGVNLGLVTAVVLGLRLWRERRLPSEWLWLVFQGAAAAAIVGFVYARQAPAGIGPQVTYAEARTMPEFGPFGRSNFFTDDPIAFYIEGSRSGFDIGRYRVIVILVLLVLSARRFPGAVPFAAWALAGTSLAAYALAHATLFQMHLPNRYVRFTQSVFLLMCVAAWLPRYWAALQRSRVFGGVAALASRPRAQRWMTLGLSAGLIVFAAHYCYRQVARPVDEDREAAYAFLRTLPVDTLVAAHPVDAASVPLRTRRSVLASEEVGLPYYLGYYRKIAERTAAELAACFAPDWVEVDALQARYGADVFLVNRARYRRPERNSYVPPFDQAALAQIKRGQREGFVLEQPPAHRVLFASGDYLVVSLKASP